MNKKTISQLIECAEREVKLRLEVYSKQVKRGKMTQHRMDHEMDCMRQIRELLGQIWAERQGAPSSGRDFGEGIVERYHAMRKDQDRGMILVFVDGRLESITNIDQMLRKDQKEWSMTLPASVDHVSAYQEKWKKGIDILPIQTLKHSQKIAAFCAAYKKQFNINYVPSGRDHKMLKMTKHQSVDVKYLDYYMAEQLYPLNGAKSIYDWLTHSNVLPQLYEKNHVDDDGLPRYFNKKLYDKLNREDPALWSKYRAKLHGLGYVERTTVNGKTMSKLVGA